MEDLEDKRARLKRWLASGEARLLPLSFPQRELWETSPVPVADPANHIRAMIEIRGPLTAKECAAVLQRVTDRQEAMRISFLPGREQPLQMVRRTIAPWHHYRDLSPTEMAPEALDERMQELDRQPFDLVQGPLCRVEIMRRGPDDHVLAFSIHHAIADGWSLGVFMQELATAYLLEVTGLPPSAIPGLLTPVAETYSEWTAAERALWTPEAVALRAGFWKSLLQGARQVWSRPRNTAHGPVPLARRVSNLPTPLSRAVKDLATRTGTTLFSTLLSAFHLSLWRWTGVDDILVGTPVANRTRDSVKQTMGSFAGVLPLRGQVDPARSFAGHLQAVQALAAECFASAIPFAELARLNASDTDQPSLMHSVFDVRFALQNHPVPDVSVPRLSTRMHMRSTGTARFDLGCEITEAGTELEVVWLSRPDMFNEREIMELDRLFREVVNQVCQNPERRASSFSI